MAVEVDNLKVTYSFAPRSLIFKLQQEVLKLELPNNWPGDKFFKLENGSFEDVSFSQ